MTLPIGGADTSSRSTSESPVQGDVEEGAQALLLPSSKSGTLSCSGYAMEQRTRVLPPSLTDWGSPLISSS